MYLQGWTEKSENYEIMQRATSVAEVLQSCMLGLGMGRWGGCIGCHGPASPNGQEQCVTLTRIYTKVTLDQNWEMQLSNSLSLQLHWNKVSHSKWYELVSTYHSLVSWCFELSQPQRITSRLKTNFSLSPSRTTILCNKWNMPCRQLSMKLFIEVNYFSGNFNSFNASSLHSHSETVGLLTPNSIPTVIICLFIWLWARNQLMVCLGCLHKCAGWNLKQVNYCGGWNL